MKKTLTINISGIVFHIDEDAFDKLQVRWALAAGYRVSDLQLAHRSIPPLVSFQYILARRLVFKKIQAALGGRVRWCISGAAPLNPEVGRFFHAADIDLPLPLPCAAQPF